jgi:hypothetical protein
MLVAVLLLSLSLAVDKGEFKDGSSGSSGGGLVVEAAAAVVAVDNREGIQWRRLWGHLMAAAVFKYVQRGR